MFFCKGNNGFSCLYKGPSGFSPISQYVFNFMSRTPDSPCGAAPVSSLFPVFKCGTLVRSIGSPLFLSRLISARRLNGTKSLT